MSVDVDELIALVLRSRFGSPIEEIKFPDTELSSAKLFGPLSSPNSTAELLTSAEAGRQAKSRVTAILLALKCQCSG